MKTILTAATVALATLASPVLAQNVATDAATNDAPVSRATSSFFPGDESPHSPTAQAILDRIQAESNEGSVVN